MKRLQLRLGGFALLVVVLFFEKGSRGNLRLASNLAQDDLEFLILLPHLQSAALTRACQAGFMQC